MNQILFQIVLLFSKLPLKILYVLSDFIFFILYYIAGYRKKVVFENIKNSFPEKSDEEIKKISKEFYHNFSDYIVETLKAFTISDESLHQRVQHINLEVFSESQKKQKNVMMLSGHVFNWEWFNSLATIIPQEKCFPIYRKMQNPFWEEKIRKIRSRYGNEALEADDVMKHILRNPNDGNSAYMFVADQTPHISMVNFGLKFLNQKTPAFIGYDRLSSRMNVTFVYCEMEKVKRGHYKVTYHEILPDNDKFEPYEVVKKFHKNLEKTINKNPDNWLWSHKRWKYKDAIKHYDE